MIQHLSCLILTYNEGCNIYRTLESLFWVEKIIVIDSYSDDETLSIVKAFPQAEVYQRTFDSFAGQCNYGLQFINSEWVLSLDADYVVTPELMAEIQAIPANTPVDGYYARFKYCVWGTPLRGTLYPPRQILYRRSKAQYVDDGHGHRVKVQGISAMLSGYVHHDDRKPLSRWLKSQDRYMIAEAKKLIRTPTAALNFADKIRRQKIFAPFVVLFYCLIIKQGVFDGWPGWYYAFQRMMAEIILSIRLIELGTLDPLDTEPRTPSSSFEKVRNNLQTWR
jgi:glycosyltransferase involved in cell wall biosynthesis